MQWRVFDDRPFEFLLKIVKKDAQTGNTVLKAGASYKIYDVTNKKYVEQVVQYPKKEKISVFKTNEEGYLLSLIHIYHFSAVLFLPCNGYLDEISSHTKCCPLLYNQI